MAQMIETRRGRNGKRKLLFERREFVIKGEFANLHFTEKEVYLDIPQPSDEIKKEIIKGKDLSSDALDYIASCWEFAREKDKRFI